MYNNRLTVQNLSLEKLIPVLEIVRNISLSTILQLYNAIALPRKPFGIGHVYFFLRMTDTMTSQNIDNSSWDILYLYHR